MPTMNATATAYNPEDLNKKNADAASKLATQMTGFNATGAQQSQQYNPYDYSGVVNRANQTPAQYQNFDYGQSANLANRSMSTNNMGQATNVNAVNNQINKAANTLSNPTMQNGQLVGQLTGDILQNLNPVRQQQNAAINQQYNNSAQRLAEQLAASGANRGGNTARQALALEQGRNTALANANASLVQNALSQALPFGQLQLSEKGLLQGQQQTAANQLASLLGQQEASRQWATGFNADQLQRQFQNIFNTQQAQAGENRFGQQFNADQLQQQFQNLLQANQLASDENRYGQQFNQQGSQFDRSLAEQIAARQGQQGLQEAGLTGQYQGQQTLAAQQLAQQIAQQALANKYTEAGLTGTYDGQNTLAGQQQQWAQNNARDLLATQLWSAYMQNAQNASVPQDAIDWINQMFNR